MFFEVGECGVQINMSLKWILVTWASPIAKSASATPTAEEEDSTKHQQTTVVCVCVWCSFVPDWPQWYTNAATTQQRNGTELLLFSNGRITSRPHSVRWAVPFQGGVSNSHVLGVLLFNYRFNALRCWKLKFAFKILKQLTINYVKCIV